MHAMLLCTYFKKVPTHASLGGGFYLGQNEFIGAEVSVLLVKAARDIILLVGARQAVEQAVLWRPIRHIPLGLLDRSEEVHASEGEGLREALRHLHGLRVVVHDLGLWCAGGLRTELRHAIEGDEVLTRDVVNLTFHSRVADALDHEVCQVLTVPKLGDELAIPWHTNWLAPGDTVEEEALHGIVVQGPIDVDGPDGSPIQALCRQKVLALEFFFVPRIRIARILLGQRQHVRGAIHASTAHENELLTATGRHDAFDERLDLVELTHIVVKDNVELPRACDGRLQLLRLLTVCLQHRHTLEHLCVVRIANSWKPVRLAVVCLATVNHHHLVPQLAELRHEVAADEARAPHHKYPLLSLCARGSTHHTRATRQLLLCLAASARAAALGCGHRRC
mmetsp:Transcript_135140/g.341904  ORF Transcript_135140/g.341904 Transcript_135140/m.341904 type:complete len:393 (-) Transcript_135140:298-1476(-)